MSLLSGFHWFGEDVLSRVNEAVRESLEKVAFQIEAQTKVNIRENDQVDTGFMMNSVYTIRAEGTGYSAAAGAAGAASATSGKARGMAPEESLEGDAVAGVCVGAEYAIWQEQQNSFLYKAGEQVAAQAGGIIEPIFRERLGENG